MKTVVALSTALTSLSDNSNGDPPCLWEFPHNRNGWYLNPRRCATDLSPETIHNQIEIGALSPSQDVEHLDCCILFPAFCAGHFLDETSRFEVDTLHEKFSRHDQTRINVQLS